MNELVTRRQFVGLGTAGASALALGVAAGEGFAQSGNHFHQRLAFSWILKRSDHVPDAAFEKILALLSKQSAAVDEVCLFESPWWSGYPAPEFWADTAEIMGRRLDALRKAGVKRVGIQVVVTLGHGDPLTGGAPKLQFPAMMGPAGEEAVGTPCPNRPELHRYLKAKYARIAAAAPDFIIVSDDVRMLSHGSVAFGCFCPVCLQLLSDEVGHPYSRDELVRALRDPHSVEVRKAWAERNARTIEAIYATIGAAVHATNPHPQTGMETLGMSFSSYSGTANERWFTALRAIRGKPDGGYYADTTTGPDTGGSGGGSRMGLLTKALEVARQTEVYPPQVLERFYEFCTFPDGSLMKQPQTAINEFAVALMVGCNGMSVDTLGWGPPYDDYAPLFEHIARARPYLESILNQTAGLPGAGLWPAWSPHIFAHRSIRPGDSWYGALAPSPEISYDMNLSGPLAQIGVPLAARRGEYGVVLAGRVAEALTDSELRGILAGGVLMDTSALRVLIERGHGDLTGVGIGASDPNLWMCRMTADPLNGRYGDSVQAWMGSPAFKSGDILTPTAPGVRWLAQLEDNVGQVVGPCMGAFENSSGGRIVVAGFNPWWNLQTAARRYQMLEIVDWLSRGKMPVRIEEALPLTPFVRMNPQGSKGAVVLLNTGLAPIDSATVLIRGPQDAAVRLASVGKGPVMRRFSDARGWGVRVHNLAAWSTVSLLLG